MVAFTQLTSQPRIALVTNKAEEAIGLIQAPEEAQTRLERFFPNAPPQTLETLINFNAVVLVGVGAAERICSIFQEKKNKSPRVFRNPWALVGVELPPLFLQIRALPPAMPHLPTPLRSRWRDLR